MHSQSKLGYEEDRIFIERLINLSEMMSEEIDEYASVLHGQILSRMKTDNEINEEGEDHEW